jgi:hypothetical protein
MSTPRVLRVNELRRRTVTFGTDIETARFGQVGGEPFAVSCPQTELYVGGDDFFAGLRLR